MAPSELGSRDALQSAARLLGADTTKTLQFTASGATFSVGQNFTPSDPWPRVTLEAYTALINYETASMRQDLLREMGPVMPRGGGVPFTGEQRQIETVDGSYAWNEPIPPNPQAGSFPAACCTPPEAGGTPPVAAPAPESQVACMLMLWSTPQGFVKAALANGATRKGVSGGTAVSFVIAGKYKMTGFINARNEVERVQTWLEQSIIGDMLVETDYSGYRDFGGVHFPSHILQKKDGFPSLDLTVTSVRANPPADITVPDSIRAAPPSPITVNVQKLADGVFWLTGGTHHSLAIEMKDFIVLVDTPNGEPRALAVIGKTKELIPGKPIRYVVAMHHHWDHMGGIRTAINEGAIIVTHQTNRALLERAAKAPFTIDPDGLSRSAKPLKLETVGSEHTLSDGARTIKLYTMTGFDHTDDMLMVYLPKERILAEADAYTPPATPTTPLVATKVPYAAALYANVRRLGLNVQTIAPFHGMRTADLAELVRMSSGAARRSRTK
jgi:glyoxylase-like metal-dependent hydrolase (beta-lactamase superfamily II)